MAAAGEGEPAVGVGGEAGEPLRVGEQAAAALPAAVRERFWGYPPAELLAAAHRDFLVGRLMEEGSGEELRWLLRAFGRAPLASLLERRGGRALSRRSRAFWARVLGVESTAPAPLAAELWLL